MRNIINVSDVSCFRDGEYLVRDLNFNIEMGSFVSFIGKNGSGKSTLVKIFSGLMDFNGYINIDGISLDKYNIDRIRKKISVVFSDMDNYMLGETVRRELLIGLIDSGMDEERVKKKFNSFVKEFGLEYILDKEVKSLSDSERIMVSIARGLIRESDIIIIDDAMSGISVKDKERVMDKLNWYKKKKKTIIMICSDVEDTIYSDRVMVMDKGNIVVDGSVYKVFKERDMLENIGIGIPLVIDLSLRFMDEGMVSHMYLDMGKLVDDVWK